MSILCNGLTPLQLPEEKTTEYQEKKNATEEVIVATKAAETHVMGDACGDEDSRPLGIPYDGQREIFAFHMTATNRISKKTHIVASKATCLSFCCQEIVHRL